MSKDKKFPELLALKGKIREEGTTYEELSKKIGINTNTLSNKINGYNDFNANEIHAIVKELNITPNNITRYFFPNLLHNAS